MNGDIQWKNLLLWNLDPHPTKIKKLRSKSYPSDKDIAAAKLELKLVKLEVKNLNQSKSCVCPTQSRARDT